MQEMSLLEVLGAGLILLAFACAGLLTWLNRRAAYWVWAWSTLLTSGMLSISGGWAAELGLPMTSAMFAALVLAGALGYLDLSIPSWLLPAGLGVGLIRLGLGQVGSAELATAVVAPVEAAAYIAAAWLIGRPRSSPRLSPVDPYLALGLAAFAAVEALHAYLEIGSGELWLSWVAAVVVGAPVAALQLIGWIDVLGRRAARSADLGERAARDLEQQLSRFQALAEHTEDVIVEVDQDGRLIYVSPNARPVLGCEADSLIGLHVAEVARLLESTPNEGFSGPQGPLPMAEMVELGPWGKLRRIRHPENGIRWTETDARHYFTADGELRGIGTVRDVTDRVLLEEQLREGQKLESVGVLAGGIAHDFNNLLAGIMGSAELGLVHLEEGQSAELRADLGGIVRETGRGAALTRQLLAYAGKGSVNRIPIDPSAEIRKAEPLLRAATGPRVDLRIDLPVDLPAIEADPAQLQQVLLNLVTNAVEAYGEESGTVDVSVGLTEIDQSLRNSRYPTLAPGAYVRIEVRDSGRGMDQEEKAKIFDPFFSTKVTGRGLGLAVVSGIVRTHGGGIWVDSAPGAGSTFQLLFPTSSRPVLPPERPVPEELPAQGLVLLVEDQNLVRHTTREALVRRGYEVLEADSGPRALQALSMRANDVNLVLIDLAIPGTDTGDTIKELRAIRSDLPILVMSGYSESYAEALSEFDNLRLIQKPFSAEVLAAAIRRGLRNSH